MNISRNCLLVIVFVVLLSGCKGKKPSLSGEDPVEVSDFIAFFPDTKLAYQFGDTSLLKKEKDSLVISYKVFTQFIPDSVLHPFFGKMRSLSFTRWLKQSIRRRNLLIRQSHERG